MSYIKRPICTLSTQLRHGARGGPIWLVAEREFLRYTRDDAIRAVCEITEDNQLQYLWQSQEWLIGLKEYNNKLNFIWAKSETELCMTPLDASLSSDQSTIQLTDACYDVFLSNESNTSILALVQLKRGNICLVDHNLAVQEILFRKRKLSKVKIYDRFTLASGIHFEGFFVLWNRLDDSDYYFYEDPLGVHDFCAFSDSHILFVSGDQHLKLLSAEDRQIIWSLPLKLEPCSYEIHLCEDSEKLLISSSLGNVMLVDIATQTTLWNIAVDYVANDVFVAYPIESTSDVFAIQTGDTEIGIFNITDGYLLYSLTKLDNYIDKFRFNPLKRSFIAIDKSANVQRWVWQ